VQELGLGVRASSKLENCTLHMHNFEIAQRILQISQIDESHATDTPLSSEKLHTL